MPIKVEKEPNERGLKRLGKEKCFFCKNSTEHWHKSSNTPVCTSCAKTHNVSEINKKSMKESKMRLSRLIEAEVEKLEIILAARGMISDKLQDMIETLASVESGIEKDGLFDQLKTGFGQQASDRFYQSVIGKIRELLDEVRSAKDAIETEITNLEGVANGEPVQTDMDDAIGGEAGAADFGTGAGAVDPAAAGGAMSPSPDTAAGAADAGGAGVPSEDDIANADGIGDADNAAGRAKKESKTIRGRQIESAIKKLRESKNPDAVVLAEFRSNLTKHSIKEAAFRTAKTFRIDVSDVIDIVKEAKEKSKKNPFGKKCPPFKGVKSKEEANAKKVTEKTNPAFQAFIDKKKAEKSGKPADKAEPKKKVAETVTKKASALKAGDVLVRGKSTAKVNRVTHGSRDGRTKVYTGDGDTASSEYDNNESVVVEARNKKRPFKEAEKKLAEAVPQGSQSPAQLRATRQAQTQNQNSNDKTQNQQNSTRAGEDTAQVAADAPEMPGKVITGVPPKPVVPPQQQQNPNANPTAPMAGQPAQPSQQPNGAPQKPNTQQSGMQAANAPAGAPQKPTGTPAPQNGQQPQQNGQQPQQNGQQPQQNGQPSQQAQNGQQNGKQIVQSGDDGEDVVPSTEKPGFNATKPGVTMMSTTRPVPKPEHSLMDSRVMKNESRMLKKYITEFDSLGMETDVERELGLAPHAPSIILHEPLAEPEEQPESHPRLLGYVIRDNHGHTHGCKWIPNEDTGSGHDEGRPKIYSDRDEAHRLAQEWTERESEHDGLMLDKLIYTVGAQYSNGTYRFPA